MTDATSPQQPQTLKTQNPVEAFRAQLSKYTHEFGAALPPHVPLERFMRVVLTAVNFDPDLLAADRASLFEAALKAAQDGLLPDKREGAFVVYNTKVKVNGVERYIRKVQWMPMVFGVLKKIRNSGELKMITSRVVYAGDKYRYWIDENGEHIEYEPSEDADHNHVRHVFAMAITKDGGTYIEPMTAKEIERVRQASRAKDKGPWVDWWDEMARKTAIRRLSKRLPMSSDLDDLVRRDDELYDFEGQRQSTGELARDLFPVVADPLNDDAEDAASGERVDPRTGEVTKASASGAEASNPAGETGGNAQSSGTGGSQGEASAARPASPSTQNAGAPPASTHAPAAEPETARTPDARSPAGTPRAHPAAADREKRTTRMFQGE